MPRDRERHRKAAQTLSEGLKKARRRAGLSQEALAREAGLSVGTVRNIEQQFVTDPGFFEVAALAAVLKVSIENLAGLGSVLIAPIPALRGRSSDQAPSG